MTQDEDGPRVWYRRLLSHRRPAPPAPAEPALDDVTYEERRAAFRRAVIRLLVARRQTRPGVPWDQGPYGAALDDLVVTFDRQALEDAVVGLSPAYDACTDDAQREALTARYARS